MTIPVWPETLPTQFLRDGYGETPVDNAVRTPMEMGPSKGRRATTTDLSHISGAMYMTTAQWNIVWSFYKNTVYAVRTFTFPEPGASSGTITVVFLKAPSKRAARSPGRWMVDLSLEWRV